MNFFGAKTELDDLMTFFQQFGVLYFLHLCSFIIIMLYILFRKKKNIDFCGRQCAWKGNLIERDYLKKFSSRLVGIPANRAGRLS